MILEGEFKRVISYFGGKQIDVEESYVCVRNKGVFTQVLKNANDKG